MQIDITKLLTNIIEVIEINDIINIPTSLLSDSLIDELKQVNLSGDLVLNEDDKLILTGILTGTMILKDDITLEPVEYEFNTEIEEELEKNNNVIDITELLWQNILVEIPSKVRSTDEDIELKGDGWRVISEETFNKERNKSDNPFANLNELLNTKEEK